MTGYSRFISATSASRQLSAIRALVPYLSRPGTISLGGGNPNSKTFPFVSLKFGLQDGEEVSVNKPQEIFQYSGTNGMAPLLLSLNAIQTANHAHPGKNPQSIFVSTGSQDSLTKAFEMCLDEGDSILLEDYTYSGSLAFLKPLGRRLVPVKTDNEGILPNNLDTILTQWDHANKKPKVLYTIPTGSNPTGMSISMERRQDLYRVAQKHDLLILEDDPYYYLQLDDERLDSLYSMDTDSRVIRFDSFSKILSSGLRLGFATGPSELIDRLALHGQATSLHTSGVSQGITSALFEHWARKHNDQNGLLGFELHVKEVVGFYKKQRKHFLDCAEKHLTGLCEWHSPQAGMFLWVKLLASTPRFSTAAFAQKLIEEEGVLVVPGIHFSPQGLDVPYIRMSFSTATPEEMNQALERIGSLLRQV